MKTTSFFLLLSFFTNNLFAQQNKNVTEELHQENYIELTTPRKKITPVFPVSVITVFDKRFDTLSFGFAKSLQRVDRGELRLKGNFSNAVVKFYNGMIDPKPQETEAVELVCYIKKFFLSDFIHEELKEEARLSSKKLDKENFPGVVAQVEVYANEKGKYYPLYRFDTTITGVKGIKDAGADYIGLALAGSLQKLEMLDWERIKKRARSLTMEELYKHYNERGSQGTLNSKLVRGVYYSFNDFKENKPRIQEYTTDNTDKGDFLYIKNNKGEDSLCLDIWGYCDGKAIYIYSAGNFFLLEKQRNSFYFFGAKELSSERAMRLNFGLLNLATPNSAYSKYQTVNKYKLVKYYHLLDMDNGDIY